MRPAPLGSCLPVTARVGGHVKAGAGSEKRNGAERHPIGLGLEWEPPGIGYGEPRRGRTRSWPPGHAQGGRRGRRKAAKSARQAIRLPVEQIPSLSNIRRAREARMPSAQAISPKGRLGLTALNADKS